MAMEKFSTWVSDYLHSIVFLGIVSLYDLHIDPSSTSTAGGLHESEQWLYCVPTI